MVLALFLERWRLEEWWLELREVFITLVVADDLDAAERDIIMMDGGGFREEGESGGF
jgi:hypothetical protein